MTDAATTPDTPADGGLAADMVILEKHGVLSDRLADMLDPYTLATWYHFTSMYSHRGDGIPTQFTYSKEVRDAALSLVLAVLRQHDNAVDEAVSGVTPR